MSNDCVLNRSQKECFILFVYFCFSYVELWNSSDPDGKFSFYVIIMNDKVLLYCINLYPPPLRGPSLREKKKNAALA